MSVINETSDGVLKYGEPGTTNELTNDTKVNDPPAYRLGAATGALGKISGDRLVGGSRKEKCLVILKEEPGIGGLIEFYTQNPGTEDDANMKRRMSISSQGVTAGDTLVSANGQFKAQLQSDGNLVVTRLSDNRPVWSWMTGPL